MGVQVEEAWKKWWDEFSSTQVFQLMIFYYIDIFLETWSRRRTTEERWSYERKQKTENYCYSSKDSVIKLTLF